MRNSFVGLIHRYRGWELASLVPESAASRHWLLTVAKQSPAACVWAVMDECIAAEITNLLNEGEGVVALERLVGHAEHIGPLELCLSNAPESFL